MIASVGRRLLSALLAPPTLPLNLDVGAMSLIRRIWTPSMSPRKRAATTDEKSPDRLRRGARKLFEGYSAVVSDSGHPRPRDRRHVEITRALEGRSLSVTGKRFAVVLREVAVDEPVLQVQVKPEQLAT